MKTIIIVFTAVFFFSQKIVAQPDCGLCKAAGNLLSSTMASSPSTSACFPSSDWTGNASCQMIDPATQRPLASCDGGGTNKSYMWFAFKATSNTTDGGINFATSYEGQYNYDNYAVTVYRGYDKAPGGGCSDADYKFTDSVSACSATSSLSMQFSSLKAGFMMKDSLYFIRVYQTNWAAGDTPIYLRMCNWLYDASKVNPCYTSIPAGCTDLTPNKTWGTDGNCDGVNDVYADWCPANKITATGCQTTSPDIVCVSGAGKSIWTVFEYNAGSIAQYAPTGGMEGFKLSGFGGNDAYAQVYKAGGTCGAGQLSPIGGCIKVDGGDLAYVASLGLTAGQTYYMRVFMVGGDLADFDATCNFYGLANDLYEGAQKVCTPYAGASTALHMTSNGSSCNTNTSTDCTWEGGCGGKVNLLSASCGQNTNTNDTWYFFCAKQAGTFKAVISNLTCDGAYGSQYWLLPDGTGGDGSITAVPDANDFCADGKADQGGTNEFGSPIICHSPGTTVNTTLTANVAANKCYYILTDGYRGNVCDYDVTVSCATCNLVAEPSCLADATAPTIASTVAANVTFGSTFDITLSEAVRCCQISSNGSDFQLNQGASLCDPTAATNYTITAAAGIGCSTDGCSDTTRTIRVTVTPTISTTAGATNGCTYDNLWTISYNAAGDIYDACGNELLTTGTPLIVLPIDLVSFTAKYNESRDEVELDWVTASEKNINEFAVEQSPNAIDFKEIGRRQGSLNSTEMKNYSLTDKSPRHPLSYYRLRAINQSGMNSPIGSIVFVKTKKSFTVISIVPVPAKDNLTVNYIAEDKAEMDFVFYDMVGKKILAKKVTPSAGENSENLDLSGLTKGVYFISIVNKEGKQLHYSKILKY